MLFFLIFYCIVYSFLSLSVYLVVCSAVYQSFMYSSFSLLNQFFLSIFSSLFSFFYFLFLLVVIPLIPNSLLFLFFLLSPFYHYSCHSFNFFFISLISISSSLMPLFLLLLLLFRRLFLLLLLLPLQHPISSPGPPLEGRWGVGECPFRVIRHGQQPRPSPSL